MIEGDLEVARKVGAENGASFCSRKCIDAWKAGEGGNHYVESGPCVITHKRVIPCFGCASLGESELARVSQKVTKGVKVQRVELRGGWLKVNHAKLLVVHEDMREGSCVEVEQLHHPRRTVCSRGRSGTCPSCQRCREGVGSGHS
jgi:hypothetical protein